MTVKTLSYTLAARIRTLAFLKRIGGSEDSIKRNIAEAELLCKEFMPSGSGFDSGTQLDWDRCTPSRLVFLTGFHHMDDNGSYDGWSHHTVTATAAFDGLDIKVGGRNYRDIKDYIAETFTEALNQSIDARWDDRAKEFSFTLETWAA